MHRSFPITMATQHPDNASVPWWRDDAFIPTQDEIQEVMLLFKDLGIQEYMWDWEGKYVDESVGEKLFSRETVFFAKHPLGDDLHLTYRVPAFDGEKIHRMARAFMNVLALGDFARDIGIKNPPVYEMFLPLTTSAEQPMRVRDAFREVAGFHRAVFHQTKHRKSDLEEIFDVTPLVEDVPSLLSIEKIVGPYWESLLKESPGAREAGQRVFLARSDPALNSGLIPAVLAVKVALSKVIATGERLSMPVYPVLGTGSLPFRGSVNPFYLDTFLGQYGGVRTYSIQSAFRYDYPKEDVKKAIATIHREIGKHPVTRVPTRDEKGIAELCESFTKIWKPTIEAIAPVINGIAAYVPPRRERLQHIGLFGYSRGVGKVRLPRAIGFTAALYSIGVPPELIGTGRGLRAAKKAKLFPLIETYYPALREDLRHAGKYLNRENLSLLAKNEKVWKEIEGDIDAIEEILDITLAPEKPRHVIHRNLTSTIYQRFIGKELEKGEITREIVEAGIIRRSLG
jgi:phosphoenolpyruvate carboxylase